MLLFIKTFLEGFTGISLVETLLIIIVFIKLFKKGRN